MTEEALPCADKLTFDTKDKAQHGAVVTRWRYGTAMKAYRCKHCTLWHLASDYTGNDNN